MNDKIMNLSKGWVVVYLDGTVVVEGDVPWSQVVKRKVASLHLKWYDRFWDIIGKDSYVCFQRKSVPFNPGGGSSSASIEERCIGFYDEAGRKVIYAVNEHTGRMSLRVKEG